MRIYVILGLIFALANAEKKINLEDIERDNLRAESNVKTENDDAVQVKYSPKSSGNQHYEQSTAKYSSITGQPSTYGPPLQLQNVKYEPQEYKQSNGYSVNEFIYPDKNPIGPEESIRPAQYYNSYRQQAELVSKKTVIPYHPQRFLYQPEVVVGNQIQSDRQKAITEKYLNTNKGIFYVDVPMTQLLSYYSLDDDTKTAAAQSPSLLHQLPTNGAQEISIPIYANLANQKQYVTSTRNGYQAQQPYAPAYIQPVTTYYPKVSKSPVPSIAVKNPVAPVLSASTYVQPATQPKKYLYTEAYLHPQTQYVQQFLYNQPGPFYAPSSSFYGDLYTQAPAYVQENSLQGHANQYSTQPQQLHLPSSIVEQLTKQIGQGSSSQDYEKPQQLHLPSSIVEQLTKQIGQGSSSQDYEKIPDEPRTNFVPPQYTAQAFKPSLTRLTAVPSDGYVSGGQDEPRSLLDSYIPSKIIAAQDSSRYRERPIQLESGFLPSKLNLVETHKKRKAN